MSDQNEHEIENEAPEAVTVPVAEEAADAATNAEVAELADAIRADDEEGDALTENDFLTEEAAAEIPAVDPMRIITVQTTSASDKFVELNEGETAVPAIDVIHRAGLQFAGDFEIFLNGAKIELTTLVPGGSTIIIAGKVKGG